jgi:hypothetical protein
MRRNRSPFGHTISAALVLFAFLTACDSTAPDTVETVDNKTDDFSFDLPSQSDFSGTLRYLWSNTGSTATINISAALTGGIGTITVQDADTKQVFSGSALDGGTFTTETGRPGTWIVTVLLVRVEGRLTFRLQKAS